MKKIIPITVILVLASSCVKDELPVPAHDRGAVVEGQACIGTDYAQQVWFDLGSNAIVRSNSKMDWDLAFECVTSGWRVRLNPARSMRAVVLSGTTISQPLDTNGFASLWKIDAPSGAADSTAIGDWTAGQPAIALDLGYAVSGLPIGIRQLRITAMNDDSYSFELSAMDGSSIGAYSVLKDPARAYVHFNIASGQAVEIAPPMGAYDLVFTQFTTQFTDPPISYLVTGVVQGFSGARVAGLTGEFALVMLSDTLEHPFITAENAIGYDWKEYDFDAGVYAVFPEKVYIVQDAEGYFFKLHFIDFYNDLGERGCPKFEVVAF